MAPPSRKFRPHWALQYALAVAERDPQSGVPTQAVCLMCRAFDRDETEGAKRRKRKTKVHCFSPPWRPDNMRRHLEQQHALRWGEYKELSDEGKRRFFPDHVGISTRPRVVQREEKAQDEQADEVNTAVAAAVKQSGTFLLDRDLVDELLRELVDEQLRGFQLQELEMDTDDEDMELDVDEDDARYVVHVESMLEMDTIIKLLAAGVSCEQAAQLYHGFMGGVSGLEQSDGGSSPVTEKRVKQIGEVVCAVNLQRLKDLWRRRDVWTFAVVLEHAKCAGSPFLDVRVRFEMKGEIYSAHLVGIVIKDMDMAEECGDLVVRYLGVVAPDWKTRLIGVCSSNEGGDKARGCTHEIISRLAAGCEFPIFGDSGLPIKLNQLMRVTCRTVLTADFTKILIALVSHLRTQKLHIDDVGQCPHFIEGSWMSAMKALKWLVANQPNVIQFIEEYQYDGAPGPEWWVVALVVTNVTGSVNEILRQIRDGKGHAYGCQRLVDLTNHLSMMTGALGPFLTSELFSISCEDIVIGSFSLNPASTATFLKSQGEIANRIVDSLGSDAYQTLVDVTSTYVLTVLTKLHQIITETNSESGNAASESGKGAKDQVPAFLPNTLCKMRHQDFVSVMEAQRPRLEKRFSREEIDQIEVQHRSLRNAYLLENHVRQELDRRSVFGSFGEIWREGIIAGVDCRALRSFSGALAAVASSVTPSAMDSGFALMNWCKGSFSQSITDFALEAILHAQSYRLLANLQKR